MSRHFRRLWPLFGVGLFLVLIVGPAPAYAGAELRTALAELAANLATLLKDQGQDSVAIGQFTGPANLPTSAGPGIVQTLSEELEKKDIRVKTRAKFGVKGSYRLTEVPADNADDARLGVKVLAITILASVEDSLGNVLVDFKFERTVRGEATVLQLTGLPVSLPPAATERQRDQEVRKQLDDPQPAIAGTVVRSKADSPYAIEVLVNEKARALESKDGLPFVSIQRGESYAVKIVNDSALEAAVQLTIDGLSMFAFSELRQKEGPQKGQPLYSVFLVPAKKSVTIPGWHRTNEQTDRFLVTEYAKSAAATINHSTDIGTITATFQAAWPEGQPAPFDEPGKRRGGSGDATGFGPRIDVKYQEVRRELGVIRDTVSVRYTK